MHLELYLSTALRRPYNPCDSGQSLLLGSHITALTVGIADGVREVGNQTFFFDIQKTPTGPPSPDWQHTVSRVVVSFENPIPEGLPT